jgi:hypothetical protein
LGGWGWGCECADDMGQHLFEGLDGWFGGGWFGGGFLGGAVGRVVWDGSLCFVCFGGGRVEVGCGRALGGWVGGFLRGCVGGSTAGRCGSTEFGVKGCQALGTPRPQTRQEKRRQGRQTGPTNPPQTPQMPTASPPTHTPTANPQTRQQTRHRLTNQQPAPPPNLQHVVWPVGGLEHLLHLVGLEGKLGVGGFGVGWGQGRIGGGQGAPLPTGVCVSARSSLTDGHPPPPNNNPNTTTSQQQQTPQNKRLTPSCPSQSPSLLRGSTPKQQQHPPPPKKTGPHPQLPLPVAVLAQVAQQGARKCGGPAHEEGAQLGAGLGDVGHALLYWGVGRAFEGVFWGVLGGCLGGWVGALGRDQGDAGHTFVLEGWVVLGGWGAHGSVGGWVLEVGGGVRAHTNRPRPANLSPQRGRRLPPSKARPQSPPPPHLSDEVAAAVEEQPPHLAGAVPPLIAGGVGGWGGGGGLIGGGGGVCGQGRGGGGVGLRVGGAADLAQWRGKGPVSAAGRLCSRPVNPPSLAWCLRGPPSPPGPPAPNPP